MVSISDWAPFVILFVDFAYLPFLFQKGKTTELFVQEIIFLEVDFILSRVGKRKKQITIPSLNGFTGTS